MIGGLSRPSLNTSTLLTTSCRRLFLLILYFLLLDDLTFLLAPVEALHLQGTFESKDFLLFLAKFGVQKVDSNEVKSTSGYIYGNITSRGENSLAEWDMYLVVLDSDYFVQFYSQRHYNSPDRCSVMFSDVDTIAWDKFCFPRGQEDFLRRIPCPVGRLCTEELANPASVIAGNQFTYRIIDKNQPRFWYASLVGCQRARRKKGCSWKYNTTLNVAIDYDIWFVNGDPASKHLNPFEHQFSYEVHDVIEIYLAFLILNGLLLALQVWVFRNQRHVLIYLLTTILVLEVAGILCNLVNMSVFAVDGKGLPALRILGNFLDMCSQSIMMLELLYIAKGWSISYKHLTTHGTILLYTIWILYSLVYIVLFSFTLKAVDPIRDVDEWQTVPGYCILVFRVVIMFYFLYELQDTFAKESSELKRNFYIRFAAGFLVWFIYLPVVALISPKIAGLWRYKTLLGIQSGADVGFLSILVHLFWPGGGKRYFEIPLSHDMTNNNNDAAAALISSEECSSEDELYGRQAGIRLNPPTPPYRYMTANGDTNNVEECSEMQVSVSNREQEQTLATTGETEQVVSRL